MLYSMTGYGEYSEESEGIRAGFRIRSVNNKGLDLNLKLPFDLMYLENELRPLLSEKILRGRVDIFAEIDINDPSVRPDTPLNLGRMAQLQQMAVQLRQDFGVVGELDINTLVRLPDLTVTMRVGFRLPESMDAVIRRALEGAVEALSQSRAIEGEKLQQDMLERLAKIAAMVAEIERQAQERAGELKDQIASRVKLLMDEMQVDDLRLYQEIVFYADRLDVTEEITRLKSHIDTTRDLLVSDRRPLGKELDFMGQEMMREVSTIGNKIKHKSIADIVVRLKTEMEKIREQVQNLE